MLKKGTAFLLLLCFCGLLLAGCRESPALQDIVYNQDNAEDVSQVDSLINNDKDNETTDEQIFSLSEQDSDKTRDWDNNIAEQGQETTSDESAADITYDENAGNDYQNNQTYSDETKDSAGGDSSETDSSPEGSSNNDDGGISENEQAGAGSYDENAKKQVVTSDGTYIEVPENVNSVSAVGEAAVLVEMLGGSGRLAATSESFAENSLGQSVFGDSADVLWSDEGRTELDEAAFRALLAKKPDVAFEISGDMTFTEDQISRLEAAGITYVALPSFSTAEGIRESVSLVGQILGDQSADGGVNAQAKAEAYLAWYDALIGDLASRVTPYAANQVNYDNDGSDGKVKYLSSGASSGLNSLFISDWDDGATYTLYNSAGVVLSSQGVAVTTQGYTTSPLSYFMSLGGVNNMAASTAGGLTSESVYINTFNSVSHRQEISGSLSYNSSNRNRMTQDLGGESYPAVIAASSEIRDKLQSSSLWRFYGVVSNGMYSYYGFLDSQNQIVRSTISGDYEIYVNPSGVGSWYEGSVESPLEAVWVAHRFNGAYTESEMRTYISDFYSQFYGYTLSDSQITEILNGK